MAEVEQQRHEIEAEGSLQNRFIGIAVPGALQRRLRVKQNRAARWYEVRVR